MQHLIGMLAPGRRCSNDCCGRSFKHDRLSNQSHGGALRGIHAVRHLQVLDLRIVKHFGDRINGPGRYARVIQQIDPMADRFGPEECCKQLGQISAIRYPQFLCCKGGDIQSFQALDRDTKTLPVAFSCNAQIEKTVRRLEQPHWATGRMIVSCLSGDVEVYCQ